MTDFLTGCALGCVLFGIFLSAIEAADMRIMIGLGLCACGFAVAAHLAGRGETGA